MKRTLALVALAACGGPTSMVAPPAVERPCEARWLSLDRRMVDLFQTPDGLMRLEADSGRIIHNPWYGGEQVLRGPTEGYVDARHLTVVPSGVVWTLGDDTVWRLTAGAPPVRLGRFGVAYQVAPSGANVLVAGTDGIHRFYPNGDRQVLFDESVELMAVDEGSVYTHAGRRILRIPLDGGLPETLATLASEVLGMVVHGGKLLVATPDGLFTATDGKLVAHAMVDERVLTIKNLRSAAGRVYFTDDNVVYTVQDRTAVPIAIAHDTIHDLEIDGPTLYVSEHDAVAAICHEPDGAPVELTTSVLACAEGEQEYLVDARHLECIGPDSLRAYAQMLHASGTPSWEYGRDGIERSWYADGTLRSEDETYYRPDGTLGEDTPGLEL